jgi:hypothetical protein
MRHRIVSIPTTGKRSTISSIEDQFVEVFSRAISNKATYLENLNSFFLNLNYGDLTPKIQSLWLHAGPGFHTAQIVSTQIGALNVQFKAYIPVIDPSEKGALIIPPHRHTPLPEEIGYQALTYLFAAHGDAVIAEGLFEENADDTATLIQLHRRSLGSINFDSTNRNIHNFEVFPASARPDDLVEATSSASYNRSVPPPIHAAARGIVLVVYISDKRDPNIYLTEKITTPTRAEYLSRLSGIGYTPHIPTSSYIPYISGHTAADRVVAELSDSSLKDVVEKHHVRLLSNASLELVYEQVQKAGLNFAEIEASLTPLISNASPGVEFSVSWKPETASCERSSIFRYNLDSDSVGIPLKNELRLKIGAFNPGQASEELHLFVSPAVFTSSAKLGAKARTADASRFGVTPLAINPFNLAIGVDNYLTAINPNAKLVVHLHPDSSPDVRRNYQVQPKEKPSLRLDSPIEFVSNNLGSRYASVSYPADRYISTMLDRYREIQQRLGADRVDIQINATHFNVSNEVKLPAVSK